MFIYGWSIYQFLWTFPSWLKFLTLGEIGAILAYIIVTNLIDSLLVLASLIFVSIVLPTKWLRDNFIVRGGMSVLYLLILVINVAYNAVPFDQLNNYVVRGVIDLAFLHFVIGYVPPLQRFIYSLADRSTVFLYLSIPSSVLAMVVVLFLNII